MAARPDPLGDANVAAPGGHVGFVVRPGQFGHYRPAFALAKSLAERRVACTFFGFERDRQVVERAGFPFAALSREDYPDPIRPPEFHQLSVREQFRTLRKVRCAADRALVDIDVGQLRTVEVVVCDALFSEGRRIATRASLPTILLHTSLPHEIHRPRGARALPPMTSLLGPATTWREQLRVDWEWWWRWRQFWVHPGQLPLMVYYAGAAWRRQLRTTAHTEPELELVACPRSFDFATPEQPNLCYGEPLVATEPECVSSSSTSPADVYVAFGTNDLFCGPAAVRFVRRLLHVAAGERDLTFLVALSPRLRAQLSHEIACNVRLAELVDQIAALRSARLMVTHGGLNSVKECIREGVPMLVVPITWDQPGNAARVRFYRLGLVLDVEKASENDIRLALRQLLSNPEYRRRIEALKQTFEHEERMAPLANAVENCLCRVRAASRGLPGVRDSH
jgi:zeaxanthin glucosyltransferase